MEYKVECYLRGEKLFSFYTSSIPRKGETIEFKNIIYLITHVHHYFDKYNYHNIKLNLKTVRR